nr:MAG TPA: DNA-directed RNA polymerase subunit alpha [Caudoviricetes sp.]
MSIEYHMLRWRRWNLLRNGMPQGARCNLGRWAQSEPDANDVAPLSDDEADAVNRALALLKVRYPDAWQAITVRYQHGVFNKVAAARRCGTSKTTMYGNLLIGHAFLDGFIVL